MNLALLWGIRLGVLLILLTPLVYWMDSVFPMVVPKAIWSRSLIETIFAMWVILAVRRPEYRPPRSWLVVIFALFVLSGLIAAFFGVSFQRSFWSNFERMQGVFDLAHWGVLLFVLISTVRGMAQWRLLLNAMVVVGLVVGLLGVAQRLGVTVPLFGFMEQKSRLDITLGNPIYVGGYMVTVCLVALGLLVDSFRSREATASRERPAGRSRRSVSEERKDAARLRASRIFWGVTAVLAIWVIGETASRGALAALAGGLLFSSFLYAIWGRGTRLRVATAGLAALIVIATPVLLFARESAPLQVLGNITPVFERTFGESGEGAAAERGVGARIALEAFAARPITGWGGENFSVPFHRYMRAGDFIYPVLPFDRAHSQPLDILAAMGIVGFIPYAALWVWLAWLVVSAIRRGGDTANLWILGAAALGAYFVGTLFLFDTAATFLQFILLAAWAGSTERGAEAMASLGLRGDYLLPRGATVASAEEPPDGRRGRRSRRERRRQERAPSAAPGWRNLLDEYAVPVAVVMVLAASLYALGHKQSAAAGSFFAPATRTDVAERYRVFSPMANLRRVGLIDSLAQVYGLQSAEERLRLLQFVDQEAEEALKMEPQSIRTHLVLGRFYREAAADFPELMTVARIATQDALRLGPHTHAAHEALVEQALAERDLEAARAAVAVWKSEHPAMDWPQLTRWDYFVYQLAREVAAESGG